MMNISNQDLSQLNSYNNPSYTAKSQGENSDFATILAQTSETSTATSTAELSSQLEDLISGYNRTRLAEVQENEAETEYWEKLFERVDKIQEQVQESIEETTKEQMEQQLELDNTMRALLLGVNNSEGVITSSLF